MHPYAGNDANYPAEVDIPDDGDPGAAATFNVPYEGLLDRTAYLKEHSPRLKSQEFTAAGTWTAPARVTRALLKMYGGGGGGGRGPNASTATNVTHSGGGGGGGAMEITTVVTVVPGTTYDVTPGAGGVGGSGGIAADGGFGGDSTFAVSGGGSVLARACGASGGRAGATGTGTNGYVCAGGMPTSGYQALHLTPYTAGTQPPVCALGPGAGGDGITAHFGVGGGRQGSGSLQGTAGGVAGGGLGTFSASSYYGGGPGGGGGGGPGGAGGAGGAAGAQNAAGAGLAGVAGVSAAANSGAGGGGGGAGGHGSASGGTSGDGGNGGSGRVTIVWVEDDA